MPPKHTTKTTTRGGYSSRGGYKNQTQHKEHKTPFIPSKIIGISPHGCQIDVIFSIVLLRNTREYKYNEIKMIYSKEDMEKCDIVLGYGGKYDPEKNLFDYHQRNFNEFFDTKINSIAPMTTSSMIFKKFYKAIITNSINQFMIQQFEIHSITDDLIAKTRDFFYEQALSGIDAVLNGYEIYTSDESNPFLYFNSTEPQCTIPDFCHSINDIHVALDSLRIVFQGSFERAVESAARFKKAVEAAQKALRKSDKHQRRIFIMDCWVESFLVLKVEQFLHCENNFLFMIKEGNPTCMCRSISQSHLHERALFPEEWRGKEKEELVAVVGDPNVEFCHQSGFLLKCTSAETALRLTSLAVESYNN